MKIRARVAMVAATSALLVALSSGLASAHVTVSAPGAQSGGSDQEISFRVPTESDTASTVAVTVALPTDTPIASVLVEPHPGWTDKVTSVPLSTPIQTDDGNISTAVSTIEWTATSPANGIAPGQFGEFVIMAGQLPKTGSLTFKAIQKYSDNGTVSWVEVAAPGTAEPDHPAPVLTLGPAEDAAGSSASPAPTTSGASVPSSGAVTSAGVANSSSTPASDAAAGSAGVASSSDVDTALILAAIALVLGAVGLGAGFAAWRRTRP